MHHSCAEDQVSSRGRASGIFGAQSVSRTGFSPGASFFCCERSFHHFNMFILIQLPSILYSINTNSVFK